MGAGGNLGIVHFVLKAQTINTSERFDPCQSGGEHFFPLTPPINRAGLTKQTPEQGRCLQINDHRCPRESRTRSTTSTLFRRGGNESLARPDLTFGVRIGRSFSFSEKGETLATGVVRSKIIT